MPIGGVGDLLAVFSQEPPQGSVEVANLNVVEIILAAAAAVCCISYGKAVGQGVGRLKT